MNKIKTVNLNELKKIVKKIIKEIDMGTANKYADSMNGRIRSVMSEFDNVVCVFYEDEYGQYIRKNGKTLVDVQTTPDAYYDDEKGFSTNTRGSYIHRISLQIPKVLTISCNSELRKENDRGFEKHIVVNNNILFSEEMCDLLKGFVRVAGDITNISDDYKFMMLEKLDSLVYSEDKDFNYPVDEASELKMKPNKFVNENNRKTVTVDELKGIIKHVIKKL